MFKKVAERKDTVFTVMLTYVELYNNKCRCVCGAVRRRVVPPSAGTSPARADVHTGTCWPLSQPRRRQAAVSSCQKSPCTKFAAECASVAQRHSVFLSQAWKMPCGC